MSPTARGAERITAVLTKIGLVGQGFHPPTKADALCAIPPRLGGEQYIHRRVTVLLVKGRSYAQPDPRAFADAILRRE